MENKKAVLKANVIYIILAVACVATLSIFIWDQMSGASTWADYYAKEISRVVNNAEPGQKITLDVHKATEIARGNEITNFEECFEFDSTENEVCVRLAQGRKTCYTYFNNVEVTNKNIILGRPVNLLEFEIGEKTNA